MCVVSSSCFSYLVCWTYSYAVPCANCVWHLHCQCPSRQRQAKITFLHVRLFFCSIPFHPSPSTPPPPSPGSLSLSQTHSMHTSEPHWLLVWLDSTRQKSKCVSISRKIILLLELFAAHPAGHVNNNDLRNASDRVDRTILFASVRSSTHRLFTR